MRSVFRQMHRIANLVFHFDEDMSIYLKRCLPEVDAPQLLRLEIPDYADFANTHILNRLRSFPKLEFLTAPASASIWTALRKASALKHLVLDVPSDRITFNHVLDTLRHLSQLEVLRISCIFSQDSRQTVKQAISLPKLKTLDFMRPSNAQNSADLLTCIDIPLTTHIDASKYYGTVLAFNDFWGLWSPLAPKLAGHRPLVAIGIDMDGSQVLIRGWVDEVDITQPIVPKFLLKISEGGGPMHLGVTNHLSSHFPLDSVKTLFVTCLDCDDNFVDMAKDAWSSMPNVEEICFQGLTPWSVSDLLGLLVANDLAFPKLRTLQLHLSAYSQRCLPEDLHEACSGPRCLRILQDGLRTRSDADQPIELLRIVIAGWDWLSPDSLAAFGDVAEHVEVVRERYRWKPIQKAHTLSQNSDTLKRGRRTLN